MASTECGKNEEVAVQLSLEQKACLDEVIKQAELSLVSDEQVLDQSLAVLAENEGLDKAEAAKLQWVAVNGTLRNQTKGTLTIAPADLQHRYNAYYVDKAFPSSIDSGGSGIFSTVGNGSVGLVGAAVVYSGKNDKGNADCGWLVGFLADGTGDGRVYVLCGPIAAITHLDWVHIKTMIERSGPADRYYDQETGTKIYASIFYAGTGGSYYVSVSFYG